LLVPQETVFRQSQVQKSQLHREYIIY
jgi:hypothetical protein